MHHAYQDSHGSSRSVSSWSIFPNLHAGHSLLHIGWRASDRCARSLDTTRDSCSVLAAGSSGEETQAVSLPGEPEWDTQLHVPPWISANEANQVSMRLDGWAHELLQV